MPLCKFQIEYAAPLTIHNVISKNVEEKLKNGQFSIKRSRGSKVMDIVVILAFLMMTPLMNNEQQMMFILGLMVLMELWDREEWFSIFSPHKGYVI